jgi:hypothetical protein
LLERIFAEASLRLACMTADDLPLKKSARDGLTFHPLADAKILCG